MNANQSNRAFTAAERHLIQLMLEYGEPEAQQFVAQFERAQVTPERCASINFVIDGQPEPAGGIHSIADFVFGGESDLSGIFFFERGGVLAGLEVYGLAGDAPKTLPTPELLRPFTVGPQRT